MLSSRLLNGRLLYVARRKWLYNYVFTAAKTCHHSSAESDTLVSVQHIIWRLLEVSLEPSADPGDSRGATDKEHLSYLFLIQPSRVHGFIKWLLQFLENWSSKFLKLFALDINLQVFVSVESRKLHCRRVGVGKINLCAFTLRH